MINTLPIIIPSKEIYLEDREEFIYTEEKKLTLLHCLRSVNEWESKWKIPYLQDEKEANEKPKTVEQYLDYIRCMSLEPIEIGVLYGLTKEHHEQIATYIKDPMTATWFSEEPKSARKKEKHIMTAERIYSNMFQCGIPLECEEWHLNKLLTLLRVMSIDMNPEKKKMSKNEIFARNNALNQARRAKMHSKG